MARECHPTVQVFLAGGVPEVMLHLRRAGLLETERAHGLRFHAGRDLDWWEQSERRAKLRRQLRERDGIDPDDVIMDPDGARRRGLTSTVTFPKGNLAPGGSVIKSTSIDPSVVDADGVYRMKGPARVFRTEEAAIAAIKSGGIVAGDVLVLMCRGPMGSGMEEIYQITSSLKYLAFGKHVAVITDARFSGVSTGACIGHVTPEALAGGPLGKRARRRRNRDRDRPREAGRLGQPGGERRCGRRRARAAAAPAARRSGARPPSAGRHAPVGDVAGCQRRHVGRLRLRRGSDRPEDRKRKFSVGRVTISPCASI